MEACVEVMHTSPASVLGIIQSLSWSSPSFRCSIHDAKHGFFLLICHQTFCKYDRRN